MKRKRFIKNCVIVGAVMLLYLCVPQMLAACIYRTESPICTEN